MDGDLRKIFARAMPEAQWTPVETGATTQGVPDSEYCFPGGHQGWVEFKRTAGWAVTIRPEQVGWLMRRYRMGGRCHLAVRRAADELWVVHGSQASVLKAGGLRAVAEVHDTLILRGGPRIWDWGAVRAALC